MDASGSNFADCKHHLVLFPPCRRAEAVGPIWPSCAVRERKGALRLGQTGVKRAKNCMIIKGFVNRTEIFILKQCRSLRFQSQSLPKLHLDAKYLICNMTAYSYEELCLPIDRTACR